MSVEDKREEKEAALRMADQPQVELARIEREKQQRREAREAARRARRIRSIRGLRDVKGKTDDEVYAIWLKMYGRDPGSE